MSPALKKFLTISCVIALFTAAITAVALLNFWLEEYFMVFLDVLYKFFLAQTASGTLAVLGVIAVLFAIPVACYLIYKVNSFFTEKITSGYQSFINTNLSNSDNIFLEIYNDPTISLKDKALFLTIYVIYCIQLPFLYCASKISLANQWLLITTHNLFGLHIALTLVNAILLFPVALLELIKYPLVKLFSSLGLNVRQLSFLFNVSDVGSGSQSVHTPSFEHSVVQCAQELKTKYGDETVISNVLDKEFENHINNTEELTPLQRYLLKKSYLNCNNLDIDNLNVRYDNWQAYRESKTKLTLTQTINLVLTAARDQKLELDTLKCMILMRLNEGNGKCPLGMFNRIIYALSGLEAKNNFLAGINEQVCNKMPEITKQFFLSCSSKKIKFLKDNFDSFYDENNDEKKIDPQVKNDMNKLMEDAARYVFNELYVEYYNNYGKKTKEVEVVNGVKKVKEFEGVSRGIIKSKLQELATAEGIKETLSVVIDDIEIPSTDVGEVKAGLEHFKQEPQPGC